jgi:hypothetical protein
MPTRPELLPRYPDDWWKISAQIRFGRAEGRCECTGICGTRHAHGRCDQRDGSPATWSGARGRGLKVVLTVAHLDHVPEHCEPDNLAAMCQACHLRHDQEHHQAVKREQAREERELNGQRGLWGLS